VQTSGYAVQTAARAFGYRTRGLEIDCKLAYRGRGLDKLERRVGPVRRQIETRLIGAKRKIRLLEIGCGYGVVLMQLRRQFGNRVDLVGTNKERRPEDGEVKVSAALKRAVYAPEEIRSVKLPTIAQCDISNGLPFDVCSFDLVVSQMCIQYVPDKVLFLREAARVLRDDGIAMIHTPLDCPSIPAPYSPLLEIWRHGRPSGLRDYLARYTGQTCLQSGYHTCVHQTHRHNIGKDFELVHVVELNTITSSWDGNKSIYRRH
jgi:SAM-dependent methyltransferase